MQNDDSLVKQIKQAYAEFKNAAKVEELVWGNLSDTAKKDFGRVRVRQIIAVTIKDPSQFELLIDGEPLPLEKVDDDDLPLLRERGYALIKQGKSLTTRGEAYVAEWKRRTEEKEGRA